MKKTMCVLLLTTLCSAFIFSVSAQSELQDRIELGRLGGTTRLAAANANSMSRTFAIQSAEPVVEAYNNQNVVSISVQNYRGGALVEIIGPRESRQSYIDVYDMGFDVVNLSGLRSGNYTIRITMGSAVYEGKFRVRSYGR